MKSTEAKVGVPLLALLVCAGCSTGVEPEALRTFLEAQQTFEKAESPGDFLKAAGLYQSILDRGLVSGVVLRDQGNAYVQAGQRGRAVAVYRLAQRYRPRDPYLEANLRYALKVEGPLKRSRPLVEYLLFWQNWLSYPEKFHLAAAVAIVTFFLGVLSLFVRRRLIVWLASAGVLLTLLLAFSAGYDWYRYDRIVRGVVIHDEVTARKGNAESFEPAFTEPLSEGAEFRLVEQRADWLLVRLPGNQEGWVQEGEVVLY